MLEPSILLPLETDWHWRQTPILHAIQYSVESTFAGTKHILAEVVDSCYDRGIVSGNARCIQ